MAGFQDYLDSQNTQQTGGGYDPYDLPAGFETFDFEIKPGEPKEDEATIRARQHDPGAGPPPKPAQAAQGGAFIQAFAQSGENEIRQMQEKLVAAGFEVDVDGYPSEATLEALQRAMQEAAQQGISLEELLEKRKAKPPKGELDKTAESRYKNELLSAYMDLWGAPPPPGYIERAAASGMNVYEFQFYERSKPSWRSSPKYQEQRLNIEEALASRFGSIG